MKKYNNDVAKLLGEESAEMITIHNNMPYRYRPDEDYGPFRTAEKPVYDMMLYFFPGIKNGRELDEQLLEISAIKALLGIDNWNDTSKIRIFFTLQRVPMRYPNSQSKVVVPRTMQLKLGTPRLRGRRVYRLGDTWLELNMRPALDDIKKYKKAVAQDAYPRILFSQPRANSIFLNDKDAEDMCPGQPFTSTNDKEGRKFMDAAIHPHISDGKPCWGDREGQINNSLFKGRITDFIGGCKQFINIWNREGAYWDINHVWRQMSSQGGTLRDTKLDDYMIIQGIYRGHHNPNDEDQRLPDEVRTGIRCMGTVWMPLVRRVSVYTGLDILETSQLINSMLYDMEFVWQRVIKDTLNFDGLNDLIDNWKNMFPNFFTSKCHNDTCLGSVFLGQDDIVADGIYRKSDVGRYIDYQDDIPGADVLNTYKLVTPMGNAYLRMENAQYWMSSINQIQSEWACYCIRAMNGRDWRRYLSLSRRSKYGIERYREEIMERDGSLNPYIGLISSYLQVDWFFKNLKKCLILLSGGIISFARQAGYSVVGPDFSSFLLDVNIKTIKVDKKIRGYRMTSTLFPVKEHLDKAVKLLNLTGHRTYLEDLIRETEKTRRKIREITINNTAGNASQGEIFTEAFPEDGVEWSGMVPL